MTPFAIASFVRVICGTECAESKNTELKINGPEANEKSCLAVLILCFFLEKSIVPTYDC